MRKGNTAELVRRNITLPKDLSELMAELREKTGIQSDSELIRRSVLLLDKVFQYEEDGETLKAHKKNGEVERLTILL